MSQREHLLERKATYVGNVVMTLVAAAFLIFRTVYLVAIYGRQSSLADAETAWSENPYMWMVTFYIPFIALLVAYALQSRREITSREAVTHDRLACRMQKAITPEGAATVAAAPGSPGRGSGAGGAAGGTPVAPRPPRDAWVSDESAAAAAASFSDDDDDDPQRNRVDAAESSTGGEGSHTGSSTLTGTESTEGLLGFEDTVFSASAKTSNHLAVLLWLQGLLTLMVGTSADGGGSGHAHFHVLVCWPLLAPFLCVPPGLRVAGVIAIVILLVVLIADNIRPFGAVRNRIPVSFPWSVVSFLIAAAISLSVSIVITAGMHRCRRQIEKDTTFVDAAASALADLRINNVRELVSQRRAAGHANDELAAIVDQCATVLASVMPYLPQAMLRQLAGGAEEFSDDEDDAEDGAGGAQEQRPADAVAPSEGGAVVRSSAASGAASSKFRKRRCTVMLLTLTRFPFDDVAAAAKLSERFCSALFPKLTSLTGIVDILSANFALVTFNCHSPCYLRDAKNACILAMQMSEDLSDVDLSIVIDHGFNLGGLCGAENRRADVVAGPSVELVHKLASLGPIIGTRVLLTEAVYSQIGEGFDAIPVETVAPSAARGGEASSATSTSVTTGGGTGGAGRQTLTLFELRALRPRTTSDYVEAFALLRKGDFAAAYKLASTHVDMHPNDFQGQRLKSLCEQVASGAKDPSALVRRELLWETFFDEADAQSRDAELDAGDGGADDGAMERGADFDSSTSASMPNRRDAMLAPPGGRGGVNIQAAVDNLRINYAEVPKVEKDDGLFSMFVDDADAPSDATAGALVDVEALPLEVVDSTKNVWKRGQEAIGTGAFSVVYLGLGGTGTLVAMKCFELASRLLNFEGLEAEVNYLARLRHANIVNYESCCTTRSHFIIITEYVSGGSLHDMLLSFGPLPDSVVRLYVRDMLAGLQYLHEHRIVHCDIKPHNALLTHEGSCKLSDFGSALMTKPTARAGRTRNRRNEDAAAAAAAAAEAQPTDPTLRGTSWYLAPEAARNQFTPAIDIWSLGVTVLELLTGQIPWKLSGGNEMQFLSDLVRKDNMVPNIDEAIPLKAADFCRACLQRDPAKRPSAQQLLVHEFLR